MSHVEEMTETFSNTTLRRCVEGGNLNEALAQMIQLVDQLGEDTVQDIRLTKVTYDCECDDHSKHAWHLKVENNVVIPDE